MKKNNTNNARVSPKTQFWLFKKNNIHKAVVIAFFIVGCYGLYQGFAFKRKQIHTIDQFAREKNEDLQLLTKGFTSDTTTVTGKTDYENVANLLSANRNIILPAFKTPTSTALFCIGQADVFPYYYTVKIESFFMQLFKQGEIANPLRSLVGHFDITFWIIYLLPLLIIILCFNTLSNELDNGNWRLIHSQGITKNEWLQAKFIFVAILIEAMVGCLLLAGILINYFYFNQVPTNNDFLLFIGTNLYFIFWLAIVYCINTIGKTTRVNALYCGIVWTMTCLIIPALSTAIIENSIPVDNTVISRVSRRPQNSKFEEPTYGIKLIEQFGRVYPLYKNATITPINPSFSLAVYLSYHRFLDDKATFSVKKYFTTIEKRQQLINASVLINPTAAIDGIFASLANNDAKANHSFIWQTKTFHNQLTAIYYPALFSNTSLTKKDYERLPTFEYTSNHNATTSIIINYMLLGMVTVIILIFSEKRLKK